MSERVRRILMYVPHVGADGSRRYLVEAARALAAAARASGREFRVLGRGLDSAGYPVPWPAHAFVPLRAPLPAPEPNGFPPPLEEDFNRLLREVGPFDVLYLPSPWGCLPTDHTAHVPAPVVAGLGDLPFDRFDFGARTDRFRRETRRLARLASGFVFGSGAARREVVGRYGIDPAAAHVVPRVPHFPPPSAEEARRRYPLPGRFALLTGWGRPAKDGLTVVRALAHLRRQGPLPLPLVVIRGAGDDPAVSGPDQQEYAARCRREAADGGLEDGRDLIELDVTDDEALAGLIAAASLLVAPAATAPGPGFSLLTALACGTPVLHARTEALTERLGDDGALALAFSPGDPLDLAARLAEVAGNPAASRDRAGRAREHFRNHADLEEPGARLLEVFDAAARPQPARARVAPRPVPRERRVAWLISHMTLRDAEVPMLRSLGLEVYTNKRLPGGPRDFRSASVDFSWDDDSTLPAHALRHLNRFNFYCDDLDPETAGLLNGYFGTVICPPDPHMLRQLALRYHGRLLIRAWGRELPFRHSDFIDEKPDAWCWRQLWRIQHRVWFATCYDTIPVSEGRLLRERSVLLPLALPDHVLRARDTWEGGDRRVLFVCPSIRAAAEYYGKIYERFKQTYGDLPHAIAGNQPLPVPDPCVLGFVPDERMRQLYRTMRVMYYHSREPRHIHYHPLEAIAFGMPVIYMRNGLLEAFDKGSRAGACHSDAEAREKLRRVLDGDENFIREVRQSQQTVLATFLPDWVRARWEEVFVGQILRTECAPEAGFAADDRPVATAPFGEGRRFARLLLPEPRPARPAPVEQAVPAEPPPEAGMPATVRAVGNWLCAPAVGTYKLLKVAWLYTLAAARQGTLLPTSTGLYDYLPARLQRSAVLRALGHCRPALGDPRESGEVRANRRYLLDPPPPPVPGQPSDAGAGAAALARLRQGLARLDAALVVDPLGFLPPDLDPALLSEERLVLLCLESARYCTDALGGDTPAAVREFALWCRLASRVVFGSEQDRREAVALYGIPAARTRVIPASVLSGGAAPAGAAEVRAARARWALPGRFLLGVDSPHPADNSLLLFRAAALLRWRGYALPPLVLAGAEPRPRPEQAGPAYRQELGRARAEAGLVLGRDLFLVPPAEDASRGALEGSALASVITERALAHAARQVCRAALQRCPVIACDTPYVREQWGPPGECALLVPADDPVALADALAYTLSWPEETAGRVERAYRRALAETERRHSSLLIELLEEVAAGSPVRAAA